MKGPSQGQMMMLLTPLIDTIAAVVAMRNPDIDYKVMIRMCEPIIERTNQLEDSVCGNRHENTAVTWADTRLIAAGYLRILLEELEAP